MANASHSPPIFHLLTLGVGGGGNANFGVRVGSNANFSVFRYQHVGIPNAKLWHMGSKPMQGSKANGFASLEQKSCIIYYGAFAASIIIPLQSGALT